MLIAAECRVDSTYEVFRFKVSLMGMINYSYLILDKDSRRAALVDPAWELNVFLDACDALGVKPDTILLTHSHFDHVNLVEPLVERFGCQVYMSAREIAHYGYRSSHLHPLEDGEVLLLGQTPIQCLLTPGHTAGGMCFSLTHSLFTGDTIFIEGCGLCDSNGGSPEDLYDSVQRIKQQVEPHVSIYPGHSYGQEPGAALAHLMQQNIYFQLGKEHFISFRMRKNQKNLFAFR